MQNHPHRWYSSYIYSLTPFLLSGFVHQPYLKCFVWLIGPQSLKHSKKPRTWVWNENAFLPKIKLLLRLFSYWNHHIPATSFANYPQKKACLQIIHQDLPPRWHLQGFIFSTCTTAIIDLSLDHFKTFACCFMMLASGLREMIMKRTQAGRKCSWIFIESSLGIFLQTAFLRWNLHRSWYR